MDIKNASSDFLESNNLITKFVFIIGLLLVFLLMLRFMVSMGAWIFMDSPTPHFTDGINLTNEGYTINVNPTQVGSKPVLRSINEDEGIEFTYSIWLYIKELKDKSPQPSGDTKCIFRKGNQGLNNDEINGPGLYINTIDSNDKVTQSKLTVKMDYYNTDDKSDTAAYKTEEIQNIAVPMRTWVNVMIRCNGRNVDVLINGILYKSKLLNGIPKQNYYDIEFSGGAAGYPPFDGFTSDFWYWNYSLGTNAIVTLINNGPNTSNLKQKQLMEDKQPEYLSFNWFI
tara:strand:- start:1505 stop:2356 length:852 start_codon:yes stop_codon:yes gene_type:complete